MGAKFSKSSKGEKKWDDMKVNGKSLPENFDKTSTLPASFRRRDEEVVMTGTLPRNLNRNQSFSKRFRKSCKNWAAQRGLIDPCKVNQTETQSQVPTKPSSVVLAQEECKDKITDVAQELPEVVITKAQSLDMLVESNSLPKEESTTLDKEAVNEVEALSNSGKAEIVIEASSQDIENNENSLTNDSPVADCIPTQTSESNSEEIGSNPENTNIENVEVKCEILNSTKQDMEEKSEPTDVETEPEVVVTKINETDKEEKESSAGEITDISGVPLTEIIETDKEEKEASAGEVIDTSSAPLTESDIVESVKMHEDVSADKAVEEVKEVFENSTEDEIKQEPEKEIITELEQEKIDTNSASPTDLQSEIVPEEEVQEINAVTETNTMESIEAEVDNVCTTGSVNAVEEPEIMEKENSTQESAIEEEAAIKSEISEEKAVNENKVVSETENEITVDEQNQKKEELVADKINSDDNTSEIILPVESEDKCTNENEITTPEPTPEEIEVTENIEDTDRNADNLVDKEEESHDNVITDDDKSKEVIANNLNISTDNDNEEGKETFTEQEQLNTVEKQYDELEEDNKKEEETCETPVNNTTSESSCETENTKNVENEDAELVCEDLNEKENVSVPNEAISSSDEIWKCQWDLPCLATKVDEAATPLQAPEITNEELTEESTEKSQNLQSELSNEEELNTMNEALDSSAVDIEPSDAKIESGDENESKEDTTVAPCEPENEKKTEAVNDELDSTTQFEGESNLSLPELEEVEMKTDNLETDNTEPSSLESLADENTSSDKVINNENKHVETAMKDILTDIVDNIALKSEMTSLENVRDAPADDLISEGGSDGCVSTDEGIAASDDDDKDSCKSDELKKDNAKEVAASEIENLITEIDQHP